LIVLILPSLRAAEEIHIAGFLPFEYKGNDDHINLIQTVTDIAVQNVNTDDKLLPGYKLKIIWNDSKVCANNVEMG